jgi:hypothetical protein
VSRNDLAVVTCHFNWTGFKRPVQNLHRFLRQMAVDGIPVYGAEASLTDQFQTASNPNWKQIKCTQNNICFQHYSLLNIAETLVPEQYTKIIYCDADLFFTNKNWYEESSKALDKYNLIQPFTYCHWTTITGTIDKKARSILTVPVTETLLKSKFWTGPEPLHTGFAWGAKRELWKKGIKLYPYNFLGGGDLVSLGAVCNPEITNLSLSYAYMRTAATAFYTNWKQKFYHYVNHKTGVIQGDVYHEYHGDRQNRQYDSRCKIVHNSNFDVSTVYLNENGLITIDSPDILNAIKLYFLNRKEDS